MRSPVFQHPILNSPFDEPTRHFAFDENGITDEIRQGRRRSTHFIPIPKPKKRGKQLALDVETGTELKSNEGIDYVGPPPRATEGDRRLDRPACRHRAPL